MVGITSFKEALDDSERFSKRHLLLGNGFSIACCPNIFRYGSLLDQARFGERSDLRKVFKEIGTQDFELVIRCLEDASTVTPFYVDNGSVVSNRMRSDADFIKDVLLSTIASNHPAVPSDIPDEKFWACRKFLNNFLGRNQKGHVFTLNYDLLLYWTLMHGDFPFGDPLDIEQNDGFGNEEDEPGVEYVVWLGGTSVNKARVHYLHGALHLFDAGYDVHKFTWNRTNSRLIDQARKAINDNKFPLFVAEGSSVQKKSKVRHNSYLFQGFKNFTANTLVGKHCFFIHGHSLANNDLYILNRLGKGKFKKIYISLFGDPDTKINREIISRSKAIAALRQEKYPLEVAFYDAQSANVWGGEYLIQAVGAFVANSTLDDSIRLFVVS